MVKATRNFIAFTTTDTWTYAGTANWATAADWSSGIPGTTSNVVVSKGNPVVTSAISIASLTNSATVTFKHAGASKISGALFNTGKLILDASGQGGSSLSVGGVLTNSKVLSVGSSSITARDTVTAKGLSNTGTINVAGGASATAEALIYVTGAAGFGTAGVVRGAVNVSGAGEIEFASGRIGSIASGAALSLNGSHAFVAVAGSLNSNSALTGLTSIAGTLALDNGASLTTSGSLANTGYLDIDNYYHHAFGQGGSSLSVGGVLTNSNVLSVGSSSITARDAVTAKGLSNTGTINVAGGASATAEALIDVTGAAGFGTAGVVRGAVNVSGAGEIVFASGRIGSIASGASLDLDGPHAFVAVAGSLNSNSALTGLTSIAGWLSLENGASITTSGSLANTGNLQIENYFNGTDTPLEGASLTVEGTFTNNGAVRLRDAPYVGMLPPVPETLTATKLINNGSIDLDANALLSGPLVNNGSITAESSSMNLFALETIEGPVTGAGFVYLKDGSLEFDSSVASSHTSPPNH